MSDKENTPPSSPLHTPARSPSAQLLLQTPRRRRTPQHPSQFPVTPSDTPARRPPSAPWPRLKKKEPVARLVDACREIFGYAPRDWQLDAAVNLLEGKDIMAVAGTGAGKSLVFALLAIAAELTHSKGLVLVICPLKALQLDQVRRFQETEERAAKARDDGRPPPLSLKAIAINEDNNDPSVFRTLASGLVRLCYASPECLLRHNSFKKLFRSAEFRAMVVGCLVDEAHVIHTWKTDFRKDYGQLDTLKIICGTEIPWGALSATMPTPVFEDVFKLLGMGHRPFWGIDLGADRPNLLHIVRPMEYPSASFTALFPFLPEDPNIPEDLKKTILYFSSRRQCRSACSIVRALLPEGLRPCLRVFTATNSEEYKETVMGWFRDGRIRWLFCTDAAGMGCDIPDISTSIIYGVQDFCNFVQKGGRAARQSDLKGTMVWIVEDWVFEPPLPVDSTRKLSVAEKKAQERRSKLDPASDKYIQCSQSDQCMREYMIEYLHPQPSLPGFPSANNELASDDDEDEALEDILVNANVVWEVKPDNRRPQKGECCSARCCRVSDDLSIGLLTDHDRSRIKHYLHQLQTILPPNPSTPSTLWVMFEQSNLDNCLPE